MAFTVSLWQNSGATHPDRLTLKAESETETQSRSPIALALPSNIIFGLDLGRNQPSISITGIVDYAPTEIIVANTAGFVAGDLLIGTSAENANLVPVRTPGYAPYCTIVGIRDSTTFVVSGWAFTDYFYYGEALHDSGSSHTTTAGANFPSLVRLKQAAAHWYKSGALTLNTQSGAHTGLIKNLQYSADAGREDRYNFKMDFVITVADTDV